MNEYLVALGWQVNQGELRKFTEALRHMSEQVERYTNNEFYGIVPKFAKAGAMITGVLASIAAGTVGLLAHTAKADLDFQVLARRMFMTGDAAKQMKIATDALGYSLEDIIWGPPELRRRYATLIEDQRKMQSGLGPDFEKQMLMIRDIGFEFTRFEVELQYFAMNFAKSMSKALFGDENALLPKLREFNDYFQQHMPEIADKITSKLVPALKQGWEILKDVWDVVQKIYGAFKWMYETFGAKTLGGAVVGGYLGGPMGAVAGGFMGAVATATDDWTKRAPNPMVAAGQVTQYKLLAKVLARKYGVDPSVFASLIQQESGWNPNATNKDTGAFGLGQFMPGNMHMYGMNAGIPEQNLEMSAHYLGDLLKKYHGDWNQVLKEYGGFSTKDPSGYINSIMGGAKLHPSSFSTGGGGGTTVNVNVANSNASAQEIASTVERTLDARDKRVNQRLAVQLSGAYA
jgi:hypothetical protein